MTTHDFPVFLEFAGASQASDYLTLINHSRIVAAQQAMAAQTTADAALLAAAYNVQAHEAMFRSPSAGAVHGRKRPLSSSPYSDSFDINSMIRFSPNSLTSIMNASRSSSATGSYGHLSAGAMSPSLSIPTGVLHPLHHLMRSPTLVPPALHSSASLSGQHSAFSHYPTGLFPPPCKTPASRETASCVVSSTVDDDRSRRAEATSAVQTAAPSSSRLQDDDEKDEEPGDLIETNCKWENCCREFGTQEELVKHLKEDHIENNKKSFICCWRDCSRERKPFKAQYMLVVHMRRHTGEKPHKCTFEGCNKAYSRLENQKTHLRSHTGEKPYNCEFPGCAKAFTNASDRAKHQNRTHSNDKPYACNFPGCTKRYTDPSSLRKHVKTVHGPEAYANKKHKGHDRHRGPDDGSGNSHLHPGSPAIKGEQTLSPISSPPVTSPSTSSPSGEENVRSPDGGDTVDTPMEQMQNLRMDAPISDNSVSTTCVGSSAVEVAVDWGLTESVSTEEDFDVGAPRAVAVAGGGSYYEGGSLAVKSGKSIKSRIKSGVKTAKSWIPKVFGHKTSQVAVGVNSSHKTTSSKKSDMKVGLVRQGSTSSSLVSAYSSLAGSVSGSQATSTSYSTCSATATGSQMTRCASYDPLFLSSRRSSSSSITTSSESPAKAASHSQCKARHLSHTDNLIVQPQSVAALSSAVSSEGYGSSLSTLNSTSSLPFSSVDPLRSDTGSGSNSTTMTVTTQIHHPNENVVLDECDSDQPIEFNHNLILPDDVMRYLKESSESQPATTTSGETSLRLPTDPQVPNLMPPGPLSPNSAVTQPSPSAVLSSTAAPFDARLTNLSGFATEQPQAGPFSPMQVDPPQAASSSQNPVSTPANCPPSGPSFGPRVEVAGVTVEERNKAPPAYAGSQSVAGKEVTPSNKPFAVNYYQSHPQTQQTAYQTLASQQQLHQQQQQQFVRQHQAGQTGMQSQWHARLHQQQTFASAGNLFQVPNGMPHSYAGYGAGGGSARSQAMTGTSRTASYGVGYNYMQSAGNSDPRLMTTTSGTTPSMSQQEAHHGVVFNRSQNPSDFPAPQLPAYGLPVSSAHGFPLNPLSQQTLQQQSNFYPQHHHHGNSNSSTSHLLNANMVINDLNSTQAALIEETRFLKHHHHHHQVPG